MGRIRQIVADWWADMVATLYPRVCEVCGESLVHGEELMCLRCLHSMPRTYLHREPFTTIHQRVLGHAPVDRGAAWFYYHRGNPYTKLIQMAKYNGRPSVARAMARLFATELEEERFFEGIDAVVAVPMHVSKRRQRGYNQAEEIAREVAAAEGLELVTDALVCTRSHSTQTRLGALGRWLNARDSYGANHDCRSLAGRHVLVVDDVLTTGATLHACCEALCSMPHPPSKISILTLGITALA